MPTKKEKKKAGCKLPRVIVRRIKLDRQGYTSGGRYYGAGAPLYEFETADGQVEGEFRAGDRKAALAKAKSVVEARVCAASYRHEPSSPRYEDPAPRKQEVQATYDRQLAEFNRVRGTLGRKQQPIRATTSSISNPDRPPAVTWLDGSKRGLGSSSGRRRKRVT